MQLVEELVRLVKNGDTSSLTEVRQKLGKTQNEVAVLVGVPESQLEQWENGEIQPSHIHHALWKLRLSDYVDDEICRLLGTENNEVVNKFWELIWSLND